MAFGKVKHLSPFGFLDALQTEYIVCELRRRIYVKKKDKDYYSKVLEGKARKIRDICERNSLPSIFTDDSIKKEYYIKTYPTIGYPNFHYKEDQVDLDKLKEKDFNNYYYEGSDFRVSVDGVMKVGELKYINVSTEVAFIKLRGDAKGKYFNLTHISRII